MFAPMRPRWIVGRCVLIAVAMGWGAILLVDGVLLSTLGGGVPLVGHVDAVSQSSPESPSQAPEQLVVYVDFTYVRFSGTERSHRCPVPVQAAAGLRPGDAVDVYERASLFGTYICVKAGIEAMQAANKAGLYWGIAVAVVAVLMILTLLIDTALHLWRMYTATQREQSPEQPAKLAKAQDSSDGAPTDVVNGNRGGR